MKKYEYMTVDLSAEPSFNVRIKQERMTGSIPSLSVKFMMKNNRQETYNL